MLRDHVTASFMSGGITGFHVRMLEEGLVQTLYDVQCFDLDAIDSLKRNQNHIAIDASMYANPAEPKRVIRDLDVVVLGATEIDLSFNVNVTTDSHGTIIGGSGGHSDTAQDAKLTVIVAPSMRSRLPLIRDRVTTITTPGSSVDVLVTERGIAIHPSRTDLIERLTDHGLPIVSIEDLQRMVHAFTGVPKTVERTGRVIGVVEDRTQRVIDTLRQTT
jgi:citrate lyase subunit alpha/citrate CoA-transferase